jgi:hypothetical protein
MDAGWMDVVCGPVLLEGSLSLSFSLGEFLIDGRVHYKTQRREEVRLIAGVFIAGEKNKKKV